MAPTSPPKTAKRSGLNVEGTPPSKWSKHRPPATDADDDEVEVLERPRSLAVGVLIEAKDEEDMWYPAHVVAHRGKDVRIHFDGWESQWDEWIPKASERLRKHRGWGTSEMPKDWQQDSIIEALDMEGKWYQAKVLHVSETACKVHYKGWQSKWDEWVRKNSGRMRRLDEKGPKGVRLVDDGRRGDTSEDLCALCEEPGDLLCCEGRCGRVFHLSCIPPNNPPPSSEDASERWVCSDCQLRRYRCFQCKEWGAERYQVHACGRRGCGKAYHVDCLMATLMPYKEATLPPFPPPVCQRIRPPAVAPSDAHAEEEEAGSVVAEGAKEEGEEEGEEEDEDEEEVVGEGEQEEEEGEAEEADEDTWRTTGHAWIGKRVRRFFDGVGHDGTIVRWMPPSGTDMGLWHMDHDDGDEEDLDEEEVRAALSAREVGGSADAGDEGESGASSSSGAASSSACTLCDDDAAGAAESVTTWMRPSAPPRAGRGRKPRPSAWLGVICARHWCVACGAPEGKGYGKAMVNCVRCPMSMHRACVVKVSHTPLTSCSFLCTRCEGMIPKGLNAPDPYLPPERCRDSSLAEELPPPPSCHEEEDNVARMAPLLSSLSQNFATAKLGLKGASAFEPSSEILEDLDEGRILPSGSFQPPPYAQIRRSVYVHEYERERLEADEVMVCSCSALRGGCAEQCQNAAMQHECNPSTCPMGSQCTNRPFSTLPPVKELPLQLFKTRSKGWGVQATRNILEGELVVEYVGEVIDVESWEARKSTLGRYEHMYFMALNAEEIVDASRRGNIARFINHSCAPNLQVEKWYVNRNPRLGLWAKRDIAMGEELSYNYSVKWHGDPDHAQACHCGAAQCTGYMGRPPKR